MQLKQIGDNVYYIPNPVNIGVIVEDGNALIVDSGLDKEAGRKIFKLLNDHGLTLKAIVNTHSHADHFGGNNYLTNKTNAKVYAPEVEVGVIQYPYLEPFYLFSAHPPKDLMGKFLMAKPSKVDCVIKNQDTIEFCGLKLKVIPLLGHSPNQIGIEVENTLFCADTVFSESIINKYKIPLFVDIENQKKTLKLLEKSKYDLYIPSHADATDDITDLINANLKVIEKVENFVLSINKPKTTEQIFKEVCRYFGIKISNLVEYYLMASTIRAYLSYLYNEKQVRVKVEDAVYWY
ncbi:MBL fold metallo-hydrolase [Archaeoglobales archaeon]|mgnify:CR=1 FL=1|nr:MAG: MBL fold metallo-hydrolase [Archaeoglobales archaeon]